MSKGFTTPEDLAEHGRDYVKVGASEIQRIVTLRTSGSTGAGKRLYFTAGDLQRTKDFFRDGMRWLCSPGDKVAILLGSPSPDGVGRLLEEGLRELGAEPSLLCLPTDYEETAKALRALQPDTLVGLPVQIRRLALAVPQLRPKTVLLSGDYVSLAATEAITRLWHTKVFSHYGLTESGLGFAVQCPLLLGQHIRASELQVEIVDPDTGENLPEGKWGEIVFTTLRREAMPLRRYRTGDISRLLPGVCPCGNPGPRLDRVLGRVTEMRKPVSIYALDEVLLQYDGVLDYTAVFRDGTLTVTLEGGEPEAIRALLVEKWPEFSIEVNPGVIPPSAQKRMVKMM
ncbi:MAG: phenylacetate--CoA ligase family protein [Oscillospiraceae bacterium]|nr:phenylacetate--CoA ligase family protein [Oscillospiraceae bacterium]